jgi:hypothetical protein
MIGMSDRERLHEKLFLQKLQMLQRSRLSLVAGTIKKM